MIQPWRKKNLGRSWTRARARRDSCAFVRHPRTDLKPCAPSQPCPAHASSRLANAGACVQPFSSTPATSQKRRALQTPAYPLQSPTRTPQTPTSHLRSLPKGAKLRELHAFGKYVSGTPFVSCHVQHTAERILVYREPPEPMNARDTDVAPARLPSSVDLFHRRRVSARQILRYSRGCPRLLLLLSPWDRQP